MPHHKKQFTDKMVEFTAKTMDEQRNMRRIRQEERDKLRGKAEDLARDFRTRAVATLEETRLAADTAKLIFEDISEDLWSDLEEIWKR